MLYTLDYAVKKLSESIDSDDILHLASEIESNLTANEILELKIMLNKYFFEKMNLASNPQQIRFLLNYLIDENDFIDNCQ